MASYTKHFDDVPASYVRKEAELLNIAAAHGLAPEVFDTDNETYIEMEILNGETVEGMYGNDIRRVPKYILAGMFSILWHLYHVCGIEYVDVWPRNFMVANERLYIIDFGDAIRKQQECDDYLKMILKAGKITKWNPDFR